jgi:hypothetical protein
MGLKELFETICKQDTVQENSTETRDSQDIDYLVRKLIDCKGKYETADNGNVRTVTTWYTNGTLQIQRTRDLVREGSLTTEIRNEDILIKDRFQTMYHSRDGEVLKEVAEGAWKRKLHQYTTEPVFRDMYSRMG